MAKKTFAADVTFKTCPQKSNKIIIFDREHFLNFQRYVLNFLRKILLKSIPLITSSISLRLKT